MLMHKILYPFSGDSIHKFILQVFTEHIQNEQNRSTVLDMMDTSVNEIVQYVLFRDYTEQGD